MCVCACVCVCVCVCVYIAIRIPWIEILMYLVWECCLDIKIFKSSPCHSSDKPRLRTTDLVQFSHVNIDSSPLSSHATATEAHTPRARAPPQQHRNDKPGYHS